MKVRFFTLLRQKIGIDEIDIEADQITVKELLHKTADAIKDNIIIEKLLEPDGSVKRGNIILVNGLNIFSLDKLNTVVKKDDVISLFPAGGGG